MLKAIIFDFDGVIWNTYDINFQLSKKFDPNISEQDFQDHHNGNVFEEPKILFQEEDLILFFEKQKQLFTQESFFDIQHNIEWLSHTLRLFIVSSTLESNIEYFLELWRIRKFFKEILWKTAHKSKIEKFRIIFEKYNLRSEECIFITDTIWDIKEWKQSSLKTIAVTWWFHSKKLLESQNPYAIANNTTELIKIIEELKKCS